LHSIIPTHTLRLEHEASRGARIMKTSARTALAIAVAIAMQIAGADDNPAQHPSLAVALKAARQGDGVLVELEKIAPFDESNLTREYREQRFETLLNLIRAEGAVCADAGGTHAPNPVKVRSNPLLNEAAYLHAHYLAEERSAIKAAGSPSAHTQTLTDSPLFTGANMGDRAMKAGYTGFANGENFAGGNGNDVAGQSIVQWFNSTAGHCSGMFGRNFDAFGFGAENYVNEELHGNNEFKSIFVTGTG
jgi:uncharacterized protein YkwD